MFLLSVPLVAIIAAMLLSVSAQFCFWHLIIFFLIYCMFFQFVCISLVVCAFLLSFALQYILLTVRCG